MFSPQSESPTGEKPETFRLYPGAQEAGGPSSGVCHGQGGGALRMVSEHPGDYLED